MAEVIASSCGRDPAERETVVRTTRGWDVIGSDELATKFVAELIEERELPTPLDVMQEWLNG